MKNFDLAAAKCGAIVCTKAGWAARILCFNFNGNDEYHICAAVMRKSVEFMQFYMDDGRTGDTDDSLDLMMADDDYLENLERGEYGTLVWQEPHRIITPEQIASQPFASIADEGYWRKMYAGMAMQGLCSAHGTSKSAEHIARGAVECADAIIEELKK